MTDSPEHRPSNNRRYWLSLFLLTTFCCALIVILGWHYHLRQTNPWLLTPDITISPNRQFFLDDPVLGYRNNTGTFVITLRDKQGKQTLDFDVAINFEGYRTTSVAPSQYDGKPEIWIFGCSYTWGWAISNSATFPWLLQNRFNAAKINNYAAPGYGNVHALLQLQQLLGRGKHPIIAVFAYNHFHLPRNVAAPSRLKEFQSIRDVGLLHHPQAYLDANHQLQLRSLPLVPVQQADPDVNDMIAVTQQIFTEIYRLCASNAIAPILGVQTEPMSDPVISFCRERGYAVVDMRVDNMRPEYNNAPLDVHPNARAHALYAEKLGAAIQIALDHMNRQRPLLLR